MTRMTLRTAGRLHFGLLSWGEGVGRRFGGSGLMVQHPGVVLSASEASDGRTSAHGPLSERVLEFASKVEMGLTDRGMSPPPLAFQVESVGPQHSGLGVGTQLGLAVARLSCTLSGWSQPTTEDLAALSGRGLRSGIGLHGFMSGGLIVDGGRGLSEGIPPLLARLDFPADWSILLVIAPGPSGLHGSREVQAFRNLPDWPSSLVDRLCRLTLLGLLPAVVERDLGAFGQALEAIQEGVGRAFAPAQGGSVFASDRAALIFEGLRSAGLTGLGQSSWGPTLYGFARVEAEEQAAISQRLATELGMPLGSFIWTRAADQGAVVVG